MADGLVQVAPDSTGKKVDTSELTVGANTVERQRVVLADDATAAALAKIQNSAPAGTEYALVTRSIVQPQAPPAATTGNITASAQTIGPVTMGIYDGLSVQVSGTYAGVTLALWGSNDNSIWFPVTGVRSDTGQAGTSFALAANATLGFDISIGEALYFKVTSTAWTSGTCAVNVVVGMFAAEPFVAATVPDLQDVFITGATAQSASGNNVMLAAAGSGSVDTLSLGMGNQSLRSFMCQIEGGAGISSGAVTFEGSNDGTNFVTLPVWDSAVLTGTPIQAAITIAASTHRFFTGKTLFRYVRCRISTVFVGGTIQAFTKLSAMDFVPPVQTVGNPTAANLNATIAAIPAGANLIGKTGIDQTTLGTTNMVVAAPGTLLANACAPYINATLTTAFIKASAGNVYGMSIQNNTASVIYIQFYNQTTAPTLGTGVVWFIAVPASGTVNIPAGAVALANFATGIAIGASTTPTGAGTPGTAPAVTVFYK